MTEGIGKLHPALEMLRQAHSEGKLIPDPSQYTVAKPIPDQEGIWTILPVKRK